MTVANSFNESGYGPNYEHDEERNEEHDEGDYPHLNLNSGIRIDNLNTEAFVKTLSKMPKKSQEVKDYLKKIKPKSLFEKITELSTKHTGLKIYEDKHENIKKLKDKFQWNKEVLHYCKENGIDLGPKPVRTKKETNKVNATAHHLKHFSVEERKNKHGYYLNISVKEHDNHDKPSTVAYKDDRHETHTNKLLHDGYHAPEFKYNYPRESKPYKFVKPFENDPMGRPVVQDGVGRL